MNVGLGEHKSVRHEIDVLYQDDSGAWVSLFPKRKFRVRFEPIHHFAEAVTTSKLRFVITGTSKMPIVQLDVFAPIE